MEEMEFKEIIVEKIIDGELEKEVLPLHEMLVFFECAIKEITTKFEILAADLQIHSTYNSIETIKSRVKTLKSIFKKMKKKNIPITIKNIYENLNDIAGIRVITPFEEDIYKLVANLLKQDDITLIQMKDYIKNPKKNGYRSLHLIVSIPIFLNDTKKNVNVEIQFRTIAMDAWATLEHKLMYKKDLQCEEKEAIEKELARCAELSYEFDKSMGSIKKKVLPEK